MIRTHAFILSFLPFEERHAIVSLFSKDLGLIKLFVKNAIKQRELQQVFLEGEWLLNKGKGDLFKLEDLTPLHYYYLHLRQSSLHLEIVHEIRSLLLKHLNTEYPCPQLYNLLKIYIEQLTTTSSPQHLLNSFYLKFLKHEGYLNFHPPCQQCGNMCQPLFQMKSSFFCAKHAFQHCTQFNEDDLVKMNILAEARSFSTIETLSISLNLSKKIKQFFTGFFYE